jgi:hypothetical protein
LPREGLAAVINGTTNSFRQSVASPNVNARSIAVDLLNGGGFAPLEGTAPGAPNALCPSGRIAMYAETIPELGTLPIISVSLLCLAGLSPWRHRDPHLS